MRSGNNGVDRQDYLQASDRKKESSAPTTVYYKHDTGSQLCRHILSPQKPFAGFKMTWRSMQYAYLDGEIPQ